jgi:MSHA pilin protein MshD
MTRTLRNIPRRGLTLIESVVAVVLVSTLVVSALRVTASIARTRLVQKDRSAGMTLARDLMSEIMQRNYVDPDGSNSLGPDSGETRATYDDVDDYDGLNQSPPQDINGAAIAGYTGWTRTAKVAYIDQTTVDSILGSDSGLKRITVSVTSPTGIVTTLRGLRTSSSAYDRPILTQRQYVSESIISLQVGTDASAKIITSVNPVNLVP